MTAKISLCLIAVLLGGCTAHIRYNESARLMQRADFDAARTTAPEWCRDALKTINALELEVERR